MLILKKKKTPKSDEKEKEREKGSRKIQGNLYLQFEGIQQQQQQS